MSNGRLEKIDDNHITDPNDLKAGETYYLYRTTGSSEGPLHIGTFEVLTGKVLNDPRMISGKSIVVKDQGAVVYRDLWNLGLASDFHNDLWSSEQYVSTKPPAR